MACITKRNLNKVKSVERTGVASTAGEGLTVAAVGAVLGWFAGQWLHPIVGAVMAAIAGVNGLVSGWRGVYAWRATRGWLAFVLDSTWATLSVGVGLLAHAMAVASKGGGYHRALSHRENRHVYCGGANLQPGMALTVGNVISNAGDVSREGRHKLITDHEAVHVWQARWFGPLYLPLYGLWSLAGVAGGVVIWLRRGRNDSLGKAIESCSYYLNPFEWWAYSRDGYWPPAGLLNGLGWRKPAARPFAEIRRRPQKPE